MEQALQDASDSKMTKIKSGIEAVKFRGSKEASLRQSFSKDLTSLETDTNPNTSLSQDLTTLETVHKKSIQEVESRISGLDGRLAAHDTKLWDMDPLADRHHSDLSMPSIYPCLLVY